MIQSHEELVRSQTKFQVTKNRVTVEVIVITFLFHVNYKFYVVELHGVLLVILTHPVFCSFENLYTFSCSLLQFAVNGLSLIFDRILRIALDDYVWISCNHLSFCFRDLILAFQLFAGASRNC